MQQLLNEVCNILSSHVVDGLFAARREEIVVVLGSVHGSGVHHEAVAGGCALSRGIGIVGTSPVVTKLVT